MSVNTEHWEYTYTAKDSCALFTQWATVGN